MFENIRKIQLHVTRLQTNELKKKLRSTKRQKVRLTVMKLILIFEFSWLTEITNSIFLNIIVQIILKRFSKQGI